MPNLFISAFVLGGAVIMTLITVGPFYLLFVAIPDAAKKMERKALDEKLAREAAEKQAEHDAFAAKVMASE